jgi:hypothetical protein
MINTLIKMDKIYLCDIDGTLAHNNGHRSFYDESKVLEDTILPTVEIIKSLISTGNKVIFFSGRTEKCKDDTLLWLRRAIGVYPELYMRKDKDQRGDEIIKLEMYNEYIKDKYIVNAVFDDRLKVCRMWYDLGLFVLNCNQGLKEF